MTNFGWSYPAGAANDPFAPYNQEEDPCAVCGNWSDECICPECPICGEFGKPECYVSQELAKDLGWWLFLCLFPNDTRLAHRLLRSDEQIAARARFDADCAASVEAEQEWLASDGLSEFD